MIMNGASPPAWHSASLSSHNQLVHALPSWARAFPGTPRQTGAARRFVGGLLEGSPFCDDAVLVLSELFTNAVRHTHSGEPGGLVIVQISRWRLGVRIAVTDQGSPSWPVVQDPTLSELAESGTGLFMVTQIASHVDWHDDASGRTLCAILGTLPPWRHSPQPGIASCTSPRSLSPV
jgi:anti-sigma regulatory factor (Ser/Thr protein kinase)